MNQPEPSPTASLGEMDRRNADWYIDKCVQMIVFIGGISAIIFILGIFVFITKEGLGFIWETLNIKEFLLSPRWRPTSEHNPTYGAFALFVGTGCITGMAMVIAVPFSLGAAIYIAEFATGRTREILKVLIELLAAIPSVVWGFIGLSIMNGVIIKLFNVPIGLNILNAGVILGLMATPIMTTIAEDALKAVPEGQLEAGEAIGMTRRQIFTRIHAPQMWRYALPGLSNLWMILLKATPLLFLLGIEDVVYWARELGGAKTSRFAYPHPDWRLRYFLALLVFYLFLTWLSEKVFDRLKLRFGAGVAV